MALNVILNPETDTSFYDSVRRLLGGLDEENLPNEHISDPAVFDIAEMEVLSVVPCLERGEVSDMDIERAKLAMIHIIASKLCPIVKGMVEYEVRTIDVAWKKKPIEYDELQERLSGIAQTLLESIECYEGDDSSSIFRVAPSKRKVTQDEEL